MAGALPGAGAATKGECAQGGDEKNQGAGLGDEGGKGGKGDAHVLFFFGWGV
jgi:hypothetical protein